MRGGSLGSEQVPAVRISARVVAAWVRPGIAGPDLNAEAGRVGLKTQHARGDPGFRIEVDADARLVEPAVVVLLGRPVGGGDAVDGQTALVVVLRGVAAGAIGVVGVRAVLTQIHGAQPARSYRLRWTAYPVMGSAREPHGQRSHAGDQQ